MFYELQIKSDTLLIREIKLKQVEILRNNTRTKFK